MARTCQKNICFFWLVVSKACGFQSVLGKMRSELIKMIQNHMHFLNHHFRRQDALIPAEHVEASLPNHHGRGARTWQLETKHISWGRTGEESPKFDGASWLIIIFLMASGLYAICGQTIFFNNWRFKLGILVQSVIHIILSPKPYGLGAALSCCTTQTTLLYRTAGLGSAFHPGFG